MHHEGELHVGIKLFPEEKLRRQAVYLQLKKWYSEQAQTFLAETLNFLAGKVKN